MHLFPLTLRKIQYTSIFFLRLLGSAMFTATFNLVAGSQITVFFLLINTLVSKDCFSFRNIFQNGVDNLSKMVDLFLSKSLKFYPV